MDKDMSHHFSPRIILLSEIHFLKSYIEVAAWDPPATKQGQLAQIEGNLAESAGRLHADTS